MWGGPAVLPQESNLGERHGRVQQRLRRRQLLASAAGGAGLLTLPGKAPAQGGAKKLSGVTLNVSCWSSSYPKFLTDYIPEFEQATGAKVNYETPSFPIYNQRMDIELSTKSDAHDVVNVTFIYSGRWIGAGWVIPLTDYINDPTKTPAGWDATISCRARPPRSRTGRADCARSRGSPMSRWPALRATT